MSDKYTFAMLGGDRRQAVIAEKLRNLGHTVRVFGIGSFADDISGLEFCYTPEKAVKGADYIILPLPASRDGKTLNITTVEKTESLPLEKIVALAHREGCSVIIGGILPTVLKDKANALSVETVDYYENEKLQCLNALPSAEGAISLAMQNSEKVLEGMRVLVTGYGRIGKLLAGKLKALGAVVTVAARRDEVLCEIAMTGFAPLRSTDSSALKKALSDNEMIFNTVPEIIFTKEIVSECSSYPIYIEIASVPGGIDQAGARERGIKVYAAPSLPGRYAPVSAGEYIFETIRKILLERGIKI